MTQDFVPTFFLPGTFPCSSPAISFRSQFKSHPRGEFSLTILFLLFKNLWQLLLFEKIFLDDVFRSFIFK